MERNLAVSASRGRWVARNKESSPTTGGASPRSHAPTAMAYVITYVCMATARSAETSEASEARDPREHHALDPAVIGLRVRALREASGLSLRDLAARSGVSAPMLSQVERGDTSPTLAVAAKIAAGLELKLSQLLRLDESGAVTIVRAAERRHGGNARRGHRYAVLTSAQPGQRAELSRHTLAAGGATGAPDDPPMHEPGSRETALVERGAIVLVCDGARHELGEGDCVTFDADLPHHFENPTDNEASLSRRRQRRAAPELERRSYAQDPVRQALGGPRGRAGLALRGSAPRARGHEPAGLRRAAPRRPAGTPPRPDAGYGRPQHPDRRHAGGGARSRTSSRVCRSKRSSATAPSSASPSTRWAPSARASCTSSAPSSASPSPA